MKKNSSLPKKGKKTSKTRGVARLRVSTAPKSRGVARLRVSTAPKSRGVARLRVSTTPKSRGVARLRVSTTPKSRGVGLPGIFDVFRPGWRDVPPLPRRASPPQARGRRIAFEALFPKGGASKGIPAPLGLRGSCRPWPAEGGRKNRALRESPFNGSRYLRE